MGLLARWIVVLPAAIVAAFYAAAVVVLAVLFHAAAIDMPLPALLLAAIVVTPVIGFFAFLPTLAAVAVSEIFGVRSMLYFLVAGGAIGGGLGLLGTAHVAAVPPEWVSYAVDWVGFGMEVAEGRRFVLAPIHPLMPVVIGFAGGLVYWAVAGRSARSGTAAEPARG